MILPDLCPDSDTNQYIGIWHTAYLPTLVHQLEVDGGLNSLKHTCKQLSTQLWANQGTQTARNDKRKV